MVEKIKYTVLKKLNDIEIRNYPKLVLALVKEKNDNNAFSLLFNYISGFNKVQENIKMTAPVINSKKIEMTSPVISKDDYMAFIMPSSYNQNNIPLPLNPNVKIKIEPKKILAVLRFSGYVTDSKILKYKEKLLSELKLNKIKIKGDIILMRYNSPFSIPFLRRNEIAVEVY